jgi:uncharacterized protein (TIGR02145 family)
MLLLINSLLFGFTVFAQTDPFNTTLNYGTVIDFEGNTYKTIRIGSQTWMAENLRSTKYRNGTPISYIKDARLWGTNTTGAWCYYNNDPSLNLPYGKLYNWFAVENANNVCPTGWHVPSDTEWNTLIGFLDNAYSPNATENQSGKAGEMLKTAGTAYWKYWNEATNSSGFSAIPGAYRTSDGGFTVFDKEGYWWSSTPTYTDFAWYRSMFNNHSGVYRNYLNKTVGFSIRCVKD